MQLRKPYHFLPLSCFSAWSFTPYFILVCYEDNTRQLDGSAYVVTICFIKVLGVPSATISWRLGGQSATRYFGALVRNCMGTDSQVPELSKITIYLLSFCVCQNSLIIGVRCVGVGSGGDSNPQPCGPESPEATRDPAFRQSPNKCWLLLFVFLFLIYFLLPINPDVGGTHVTPNNHWMITWMIIKGRCNAHHGSHRVASWDALKEQIAPPKMFLFSLIFRLPLVWGPGRHSLGGLNPSRWCTTLSESSSPKKARKEITKSSFRAEVAERAATRASASGKRDFILDSSYPVSALIQMSA